MVLRRPMTGAGPHDDIVRPFRLGASGARGRHLRLGAAANTVLTQHAYPPQVCQLLGELMGLAATLSSTIKYDGVFGVQSKSDGPIRLMVADVTSDGTLRGYADFDSDKLSALAERPAPADTVPRLLGTGHLAFSVDRGGDGERYQGIVALEGATLSECAHNYFRRSEQIDTGIVLAAGQSDGDWRVGAMMLQRVSAEGGFGLTGGDGAAPDPAIGGAADDADDDWRRAVILMSSVTEGELLDPALGSDRLLTRLFAEEEVWVYQARPLAFGCRCSRNRAETMLRSFPRDEVETMKTDGQVVVTCQFCNRSHVFDDDQLDAVYQA